MTNEELDAIRERASRASTGPWTIEAGEYTGANWLIASMGGSIDGLFYTVTTDNVHASELKGDARTDAEFVAHARTDIPALLAEVERLRNQLQARMVLLGEFDQ